MKYLVLRSNAIKRRHPTNTLSSSCFPIEVEMDNYGSHSVEDILNKAFDLINEGYRGKYEYIVVPMIDAKVVSFRKPQPEYEVRISNYDC